MSKQKIAGLFVLIFVITLISNSAAIYLYNLIVHQAGKFNWETTFGFSISMSPILTYISIKYSKNEK